MGSGELVKWAHYRVNSQQWGGRHALLRQEFVRPTPTPPPHTPPRSAITNKSGLAGGPLLAQRIEENEKDPSTPRSRHYLNNRLGNLISTGLIRPHQLHQLSCTSWRLAGWLPLVTDERLRSVTLASPTALLLKTHSQHSWSEEEGHVV